MRSADYSTQFKRDFKRVESRGKDMSKMDEAMGLLLDGLPLPDRYKDHSLKGEWKHYRELHIETDWLLVYQIIGNIVIFARTGNHSDIFSR